MRVVKSLLLVAFFSATASQAAEPKVRVADTIINQRLTHIEIQLAKKKYAEAIQSAISMFSLNASACRSIDAHVINSKDAAGNDVAAHTRLDQVVVLDPRHVAFKSARFLVSLLAQQITHCEQNQKLYVLAVNRDPHLAPLKGKVAFLRNLADLDELASQAAGNSPAKTDAAAKFKNLSAKYDLTLAPEQFGKLTDRVSENIQTMQRTLGDLHGMEAALKAFELPGILEGPARGAKASPEFAFNYTTLLTATNRFVRLRQLFGAEGKTVCQVTNYVPFDMALQHERNCNESIQLLKSYAPQI